MTHPSKPTQRPAGLPARTKAYARAKVFSVMGRLGWVRAWQIEKSLGIRAKLEQRLQQKEASAAILIRKNADLRAALSDSADRLKLLDQLDAQNASLRIALDAQAQERAREIEATREAFGRADTLAAELERTGAMLKQLDTQLAAARADIEKQRARADAQHDLAVATRAKFETVMARMEELNSERSSQKSWFSGIVSELKSASMGRAEELAKANERIRQLNAAMLKRELKSVREIGALRAAAASFRAERATDAVEVAALLAEIERLQRLNPDLVYTPDLMLAALEQGRLGICSVERRHVLPDFELEGRRIGVWPGTGAERVLAWLDWDEAALIEPDGDGDGATGFDVVIGSGLLECAADPLASLKRLERAAALEGRLILPGYVLASSQDAADPWRTPPLAVISALPNWRAEQIVFAGPGARIGIEVLDRGLAGLIRPVAGRGAPLIIPPFMTMLCRLERDFVDEQDGGAGAGPGDDSDTDADGDVGADGDLTGAGDQGRAVPVQGAHPDV